MGRPGFLSENCQHSRDYRHWIWFGEHFTFSRGEARILEQLVRRFHEGNRGLDFREALKRARSKAWKGKNTRFRNCFTTESGRQAYGRLVCKRKRTVGLYILNVDTAVEE